MCGPMYLTQDDARQGKTRQHPVPTFVTVLSLISKSFKSIKRSYNSNSYLNTLRLNDQSLPSETVFESAVHGTANGICRNETQCYEVMQWMAILKVEAFLCIFC